MKTDSNGRWTSSQDFLAEKLGAIRAEMGRAILNRGRWDNLRDDSRMLVFLQGRAGAPDFQGVREELNRIADGRLRVPELSGPRRKATDCLRGWATELQDLDGA